MSYRAEDRSPETGVVGPAGEDGSGSLKSAIFSVTKGTIITLLGTVGFLLLSLIWRLVIVRLITVDQWGEISLVTALLAIVIALAPLGVSSAVARNLAFEKQENWRGLVWSSLIITLLSGLAFTIAFYLAAVPIAAIFHNRGLVPVIQILSPNIFLGMVIGTLSSIFQGFQNAVPNALFINILPNVFSIILALLLYYLGFGFTGIVYSAVLNSAIVILIMIPYSRRRLGKQLGSGPRSNRIRTLVAFGLPLVVATSLTTLMGYADTLVLGIYRSEIIIGYYSAGLTLGRIVTFGISALGFIFLPVASRMFALKRYGDLEKTYSTATKWSLIASVPLLLIFILYPVQSLRLTFGSEYSQADAVLVITAIGFFFVSLFGPAGAALVAFGRTRLLALNSVFSVAANLAASIALIPVHGMIGGAYASVIGTAVFSGLSIAEIAFYYRLHPFNRMYIKPLSSSVALSLLLLMPLRLHPTMLELPALFFVIAGFVVLCILVTKSVDSTDVLLLEVAEGIFGRRFSRLRRMGTVLVGKTG